MSRLILSKRGIGLIEVVIAIFLVAVGVMAILSMQPTAWRTIGKSDYLGRGAGILHRELELREAWIANPCNVVPLGNRPVQNIIVSGLGAEVRGDATYTVNTNITACCRYHKYMDRYSYGYMAGSGVAQLQESCGERRCYATGWFQISSRMCKWLQMLCQRVSNGSSRMNDARGFTLVEIVIAIAVSLIMILAIGMAIESASRSSGGIERKVTAQQDVRGALEIMALEIRMASYNPTFSTTIWRSDGSPEEARTSALPNPQIRHTREYRRRRRIRSPWKWMSTAAATPTAILTATAPLRKTNEIIRYNFVQTGNDRYITRETNCGGAQPFLGDIIASGSPRTVRIINADADVNVPVFRYFDGQGVEFLLTGATASACPDIRRYKNDRDHTGSGNG